MPAEHSAPAQLPFVTVVVPTHKRPDLLHRLLNSLLRQNYPAERFEIIVVHNDSPDVTETVVRQLAVDSPVPIHYFKTNYPGPGHSRQFGMRQAKGEYVAYIDDDCVTTPQWLRAGIACFAERVGIVQGRTLPHPDQPRRLLEKTVEVPGESPFYETCNIFYRKKALERAGGFSAEFAEQKVFYGEDTDVAWKVIDLDYETRFATDALVYHEVFSVSFKEWLLEPRRMHVWPYLVKKHPGLRRHMYRGYFLAQRTALFDLMLLGFVLGLGIHHIGFALAAPYVVQRLREPTRRRGLWVRLARLFFGLPRATVFFLALASGSIRFRAFLL